MRVQHQAASPAFVTTEASLSKRSNKISTGEQAGYITRLISWLYSRGKRFKQCPALKDLEAMALADPATPMEARTAIKATTRREKASGFAKFFDSLPPGQKPALVTYAGRPKAAKYAKKIDPTSRGRADEHAAYLRARKEEDERRQREGIPSVKAERAALRRKENNVKRISSDEFYESRAWLELRYRVLAKYGAKCMCCGASRDDGAIIHVDHIKPRSLYPMLALEFSNMQVLCKACNMGKSNKHETDWRGELRYR